MRDDLRKVLLTTGVKYSTATVFEEVLQAVIAFVDGRSTDKEKYLEWFRDNAFSANDECIEFMNLEYIRVTGEQVPYKWKTV